MSRDRSLDEFFSTSDDEGAESEPDTERENDTDEETESTPETAAEYVADDEEAEATTTTANDEDVDEAEQTEVGEEVDAADVDAGDLTDADEHDGEIDSPRVTYRWSPEGDACPDCGSVVEQRWRDGDRFVCADCKEW